MLTERFKYALGNRMGYVFGLVLLACSVPGSADAFQECNGSPHVRVLWEKQILEVDGKFFQMKKEAIGKKSSRLVGNNMIFIREGRNNGTLIRNGAPKSYTCAASGADADAGLTNASVQPYTANPIKEDTSASATDTTGGNRSSSSSGKGSGHGGGGKGKNK